MTLRAGSLLGALAIGLAFGAAAQTKDVDTRTEKPILDMLRDSPNAIPLDPRDPSLHPEAMSRGCPDPGRPPGPMNVQRTDGGLTYQGIPTFFHAPVALCPEDLKAGKVDVAILGASVDMPTSTRGTAWGPLAVRTGEVTLPWGPLLPQAHPTAGDIDFMQVLKIVDYGDAPVALCPEDLKAGKVDVAILGASVDMPTSTRGTAWGPLAVRTGEVTLPWGPLLPQAHPTAGDIDFMQVLKIVDYGDAPIDPFSVERSAVSVHRIVKEVAATGAIPVIVGGDHSLMYPDVMAVADVHGRGNVAVVHFDAHFDGVPLIFGHYLTHGAPVRRLIDEGHVNGKNFVQIGLNSPKPGAADMEWMRKNQIRYHFMAEIDRKGWPTVMKEALAEALDGPKKIFVSIDTDVLDPAWAPGMGTPEPGGMSIRELFPMLRALAIQNEIVGIELVELNPVVDPTYRSKLVATRILREVLTGIAMRRKGITDPNYADPAWIDHGVKPPR